MPLLILITFLSAFLLFEIELIVAKLFLPNYGGSYLVWGACIVFFQAVLLGGYCFAHFALERWSVRRYLKIHHVLLFLPFLFFPLREIHLFHRVSCLPLVLDIFWRLTVTIGPVFFVLSTMSLVTQSWLAESYLKQRDNPYPLYAVSNLGSFAALLTYPFFFERFLTHTEQLQIWRLLYAILLGANLLAWAFIKLGQWRVNQELSVSGNTVSYREKFRWLFLGAAGVVMFLSVTNIMTYEVAPVPLLWVIPLGIYLIAFVLNFKKNPWCPSWVIRFIGPIIGVQAMLYFVSQKNLLPVLVLIALLCGFLLLICLYIQNQLILSKPSRRDEMTFFYVMISLGGFLGGILTSWIIPLVSNTLIEYLIGLLLVALIIRPLQRKMPLWAMGLSLLVIVFAFVVWPQCFKDYHGGAFVMLVASVWWSFFVAASRKRALIAVIVGIIAATPCLESIWQHANFIIKKRNYYGIYEVYDSNNGVRALMHGTTLHGLQCIDEEKRRVPIGYYSPISAIGSLLISDVFQAKRVGVFGLGTGTLSLYAKRSCPIDYYELDKDVYQLASKYFWYLSNAPGAVHVILGDARLSLQGAADGIYDLLIIDAFSGDSIPTHLVNKDVLLEYRKKLSSRGAVVFHITNRYLNLQPVLAKMAEVSGAYAAVKTVPNVWVNMTSLWCILTWDDERYLKLITQQDWVPIDTKFLKKERVWSDDYSSILPIINRDELLVALKSFNPLMW